MKIITPKVLITALLFAGVLSLVTSASANAYLTGFDPERIMDDTVMADNTTMTESQIQNFLKSKNRCNDSNFSKISGRNETTGWHNFTDSKGKAQTAWYNIKNGHFVCMADEDFDGESAARIIWQAGQDYRINPQALIVLLQKEQALITDTFPNINYQYAAATGFDCPDDGAGCRNSNAGFKNQIRKAADLFRKVLDGGWSNYPVGVNYVQYNPNKSCGGTNLNIKNRTTSALYRYTPYQPNPGALSAGWGQSHCGAYGNRNFYNYFTDWFGSAFHTNFTTLDNPRWMQIKNTGAQKIDVTTGSRVGEVFTEGRQIKFTDKILVSGKWYLRTEFNHNDNGAYGIAQEDLEDIPYQSVTPKWITVTENSNRSHPASRTSVGGYLERGTSVRVSDAVTVDGNLYYRTEYNKSKNQDIGIHSRFTTDFKPIDLDGPRDFCTGKEVVKINPLTGVVVDTSLSGAFRITHKTMINNTWYFQVESDQNTHNFLNSGDLTSSCYIPFEGPRKMRVVQDTVRFNPYTNEKYDTLRKGSVILFSTKIIIDDKWYFRTAHNTTSGTNAVVPATSVVDRP